MIVPRVKQEKKGNNTVLVDTAITLSVCEEYASKASRALAAFLPQCQVMEQKKNALVTVEEEPGFADKPEAYRLTILNGKVTIGCISYLGLRNALAAFSLTVRCVGGKLALPDTTIEDWPDAEFRSIMLDIASIVKPVDELKGDLVLFAKSRMNYAQIYLSDRHGICLRLDCLPEKMFLKNAYTKEEMCDICEFADMLGIEMIPQFDMPAHSGLLVTLFDAMICDAPEEILQRKTMTACTGDPEVYRIYETIINEILDIFPGRYFHMGGDELEMLDLSSYCHWDYCNKCLKLREENGLADRQDQYNYFVKRIHDMVTRRGRSLIMWNDQVDCPRGPVLPTDIVMEFWRVAAPGRGPVEGCSMNALAEMGYKVINAYYPYTYLFTGEPVIPFTSELLGSWIWDEDPPCNKEYAANIIGTELCAWGYCSPITKYLYYAQPSAFVLTADKQWNKDRVVYDEAFAQALTRTLLGVSVPEGFNPFVGIGDVVPPLEDGKLAHCERVTCSDEELSDIVTTRSRTDIIQGADAARAAIYRECVEYAQKNRK